MGGKKKKENFPRMEGVRKSKDAISRMAGLEESYPCPERSIQKKRKRFSTPYPGGDEHGTQEGGRSTGTGRGEEGRRDSQFQFTNSIGEKVMYKVPKDRRTQRPAG